MRTPTAASRRGYACAEIPASCVDLVQCPPVAALSTISRAGYPQTSVVWCDYDGRVVRVNTMRGFAKERNMRRDPRVTVLCYDPRVPSRCVEVCGVVVELVEEGAQQHLDEIASRYAGRPVRYFGDVIPAHFAETEVPVLCRIAPTQVAIGTGPRRPTSAPGRTSRATPTVHGSASRVPASHVALVSGPVCGVLTTMDGTGSPRSRLVSVAYDGDAAWVSTTRDDEGLDRPVDTKASLLVVDPDATSRYVQIRGDLECLAGDASGPADPAGRALERAPVSMRLRPRRVICDAVHT